ncbi:MAG: hypothetical protein ABC536_00075 [Candidatus Methanosuratincola petrocarbonis]
MFGYVALGATLALLLASVGALTAPPTSGNYAHEIIGEILQGTMSIEAVWDSNVTLYALIVLFMIILVAFFIGWLKNYEWATFVITFLSAAVCIPVYTFIYEFFYGIPINPAVFFLAIVCAITAIIFWAVPLGRASMLSASVAFVIFTLFYILNEYMLFTFWEAHDPGGSLLVHVFAAYFGMGFILKGLHTKADDYKVTWEMTKFTMTMCLMGAGFLWAWWPVFVSGLMGPELFPVGCFNVVFAICGSCLAAVAVSRLWRGKPSIVDICWSFLAGGVAIGSTADLVTIWEAFLIGIVAGFITTTGFAKVWEQVFNKKIGIDVCGVQFLHGWSGLWGGLVVASIIVPMKAPGLLPLGPISQIGAAVTTVVIALVGGVITGLICKAFKRPEPIYSDKPVFVEAETITD